MSNSTHVYLTEFDRWLSTHGLVYNQDKEKCIECYADDNFAGGWYKADSDNA